MSEEPKKHLTNDYIRECLADYYGDDEETLNDMLMFEDPSFADAVIGVTHDGRLVYSYARMVEQMMDEDQITAEEAMEFIDYNTVGSLNYPYDKKAPVIVFDVYGIES